MIYLYLYIAIAVLFFVKEVLGINPKDSDPPYWFSLTGALIVAIFWPVFAVYIGVIFVNEKWLQR